MKNVNATPTGIVTLDCTPDDFRKFITSLLGKPQTITNRFIGGFDLKREDLAQFHFLLVQRLEEQNKASLVQFTARVIYHDGSTVLVNDFPVFETYNETKPLRSVAIHLSWVFLVQFENRKTPEKQEIDVSIETQGVRTYYEDDLIHHRMITSPDKQGIISFRINHTARSWASDIEALLSAHVKSLIPEVNKVRMILAQHEDKIGIAVFSLMVLGSVVSVLLVGNTIQASQSKESDKIVAISDVGHKFDALSKLICSGDWSRFTVYGFSFLIIMVILSIAMGIWASSVADTRSPAFLTLTKKSEEFRKTSLEQVQNRLLLFLGSLTSGLLIGVSGNWLFAYFVQGWRP